MSDQHLKKAMRLLKASRRDREKKAVEASPSNQTTTMSGVGAYLDSRDAQRAKLESIGKKPYSIQQGHAPGPHRSEMRQGGRVLGVAAEMEANKATRAAAREQDRVASLAQQDQRMIEGGWHRRTDGKPGWTKDPARASTLPSDAVNPYETKREKRRRLKQPKPTPKKPAAKKPAAKKPAPTTPSRTTPMADELPPTPTPMADLEPAPSIPRQKPGVSMPERISPPMTLSTPGEENWPGGAEHMPNLTDLDYVPGASGLAAGILPWTDETDESYMAPPPPLYPDEPGYGFGMPVPAPTAAPSLPKQPEEEQLEDAYSGPAGQIKQNAANLVNASPFWAGALSACVDQGLGKNETHELLKKCAQVDPLLAEEYIEVADYIKAAEDGQPLPVLNSRRYPPSQSYLPPETSSHWSLDMLRNPLRMIGGAFEGVGAGIGGIGSGIWGAAEAGTDALGWTNPATNTGFDTAGRMFNMSAKGFGKTPQALGVRGLNAVRKFPDMVSQLHHGNMDEAGYSDSQKWYGNLAHKVPRVVGEVAATAGFSLALGGGTRAGVAAYGTGGARAVAPAVFRGVTEGARRSAPHIVGSGGAAATVRANTHRVLGYGQRPLLWGTTTAGGTVAGATGVPQLLAGAGRTMQFLGHAGQITRVPIVTHLGRLLHFGGSKLAPLGARLTGGGALPVVPHIMGNAIAIEVADQLVFSQYKKLAPGRSMHSRDFSNLPGFEGIAAMPRANRPRMTVNFDGKDYYHEMEIPSKVFEQGLAAVAAKKPNLLTEQPTTVWDAYEASLMTFQMNAGQQGDLGWMETAKRRSILNLLGPGAPELVYGEQGLITQEMPVAKIELNDPAAAADFVTGSLEHVINHDATVAAITTMDNPNSELGQFMQQFDSFVSGADQVKNGFMFEPLGLKIIQDARVENLFMLKKVLNPKQFQSILDVYRGEEGGGAVLELLHMKITQEQLQGAAPAFDPRLPTVPGGQRPFTQAELNTTHRDRSAPQPQLLPTAPPRSSNKPPAFPPGREPIGSK